MSISGSRNRAAVMGEKLVELLSRVPLNDTGSAIVGGPEESSLMLSSSHSTSNMVTAPECLPLDPAHATLHPESSISTTTPELEDMLTSTTSTIARAVISISRSFDLQNSMENCREFGKHLCGLTNQYREITEYCSQLSPQTAHQLQKYAKILHENFSSPVSSVFQRHMHWKRLSDDQMVFLVFCFLGFVGVLGWLRCASIMIKERRSLV